MVGFWKWFCGRGRDRSGYRTILNKWLALHVLVGGGVALSADIQLSEAADSVLLPLFGIFAGLSFAWSGSSHALMQTDEIELVAAHYEGGFPSYVYGFQTAILILLVSIVAWGFAGLKLFPDADPPIALESALYGLLSLSIRECWTVVGATQGMLLSWRTIRNVGKDK